MDIAASENEREEAAETIASLLPSLSAGSEVPERLVASLEALVSSAAPEGGGTGPGLALHLCRPLSQHLRSPGACGASDPVPRCLSQCAMADDGDLRRLAASIVPASVTRYLLFPQLQAGGIAAVESLLATLANARHGTADAGDAETRGAAAAPRPGYPFADWARDVDLHLGGGSLYHDPGEVDPAVLAALAATSDLTMLGARPGARSNRNHWAAGGALLPPHTSARGRTSSGASTVSAWSRAPNESRHGQRSRVESGAGAGPLHPSSSSHLTESSLRALAAATAPRPVGDASPTVLRVRASDRPRVIAGSLGFFSDVCGQLPQDARRFLCEAASRVFSSGCGAVVAATGGTGTPVEPGGRRVHVSPTEWRAWAAAVDMCLHMSCARGEARVEESARTALSVMRARAEDEIDPAALLLVDSILRLAPR